MGLDMYAFRVAGQPQLSAVDADLPQGATIAELHCWRKHPNLHGWMEKLYREKGGIRGNKLPSTSGFFFGATDGSEFEDDLTFIVEARATIAAGERCFYYSWW